jgi:hypothetical protein
MIEYWKAHERETGFDEEHHKDLYEWETDIFTRYLSTG